MKVLFTRSLVLAFPLALGIGCNLDEPFVDEFPQVRITQPASSSKILDSTMIEVEASDDKGVVRIELYIDGQVPPGGILLYEPYIYPWRVSGLPDSSAHQLVAKAYDTDSNATASQPVSVVTYRFTPGSLLAAMVADTLVRLTWTDNSSVETAYQVLEDINDSGYSVIQTLPPNTTATEIPGIYLSENRYSYKVRALIDGKRSDFTNVQTVWPSLMPPLGFSFTNISDFKIDFGWTRSQFSFETRIEIEERREGSTFKVIKALPGGTTSASCPGSYRVGNAYSYRARCFSNYNASAYSSIITTKVPFPSPEIRGVTSLSASEAMLAWDYTPTFEKGFIILRQLSGGGAYAEVGRVNAESRTFIDRTLDSTKSYTYLAQAFTNSSKSGYSRPFSITYVSNYRPHHVFAAPSSPVRAVVFVPNTSQVIIARDDNTIIHWDAWNGAQLRTTNGPAGGARSIAVSPTGSLLAVGSGDGAIALWNISTGNPSGTISAHTAAVNSVAFSSDGSLLASGSADSTVRLWRISDGALLRTFKGHIAAVNAVAIAPGDSIIASGSDDMTLRLSRIADGTLTFSRSDPPLTIQAAAFSPDGAIVACAGAGIGNPLLLWKVSDGSRLIGYPWLGDNMYSLAYHSSGKVLACGYGDKYVRVWEPDSALETVTLTAMLDGHTDKVTTVAISSDRSYIASGGRDATVRIWRWKSFWQ